MIRGGYFGAFARHCRSALRFSNTPADWDPWFDPWPDSDFYIGFRVLLAPGQP